MKYPILVLMLLGTVAGELRAQTPQPVLPLYAGAIPNSKPSNVRELSTPHGNNQWITGVTQPTLTVYLPDRAKATGTSVIICPGGGYSFVSMTNEGTEVAQRLTELGIAAFILKYRLPNDQSQPDPSLAPLLDVQQALRVVREQAPKYGLNPERIGVMGFSAGGHLAAMAATRFARPVGANPGPASVRPAFAVLVYPVITFADSVKRGDSRDNLLGKTPSADQVRAFSAERLVTAQTPPVFLVHCQDDGTVPVQNSLLFYQACVRRAVPAELHLYPKGGHGFGLTNASTQDQWIERMQNWLTASGF